jgi:hypothetical protein
MEAVPIPTVEPAALMEARTNLVALDSKMVPVVAHHLATMST